MRKLIVFGAGKIAQAVTYFFELDGRYEICAYVCDPEFIKSDSVYRKPLISSADVMACFPPDEYEMFVAIGYQDMNRLRAGKYLYYKECGYRFASYISPELRGLLECGENSIVMNCVAIQPFVRLDDNVFVWGGSMIGHHTLIKSHCWLTGSCAVGGGVELGQYCFVGLNSTIGHSVKIGASCMLGASTLTCRNLEENTVLVEKDTEIHRLNSVQFTRLSTCFRI